MSRRFSGFAGLMEGALLATIGVPCVLNPAGSDATALLVLAACGSLMLLAFPLLMLAAKTRRPFAPMMIWTIGYVAFLWTFFGLLHWKPTFVLLAPLVVLGTYLSMLRTHHLDEASKT